MSELEFWYDFHSPWAYLAATQIETLAARHGLTVTWRPLHLPRLIEDIDGRRPMEENSAFLAWYTQDLQDWAELYGVS
ncbi:MAG: DsbA family protein, partial [Dongiales bacterium]